MSAKSDHKEAVRLSRAYRRVPIAILILGSLLLSGVASTASAMLSFGPIHLIP
ncbi:hypothetical protein [Microvirga soli]|jgi:hypothetical protein|uniref:hypothetical protein n=1 Tax=Microvirga soli TaxID=1854496 RepID=UPI00191E2A15|nr:hypothetical protein [Microvirga soli]